MTLTISDFWCGFMCGVVALFFVAVIVSAYRGHHKFK